MPCCTGRTMRLLGRGAAGLLAAALTLNADDARADSYCFSEACAYIGEIGILVGGVVAVGGSTVSIFDDDPDPIWYGLGYGFGTVNLLVGGVIAAVGVGLDEEDQDRDMLMTVGATQAGLGAFGVFMAALAEGHYDSHERTRARTVGTPRVVPLVDPRSGVPSGALLSASF